MNADKYIDEIDKFIRELRYAWVKYPDMRLGQIIWLALCEERHHLSNELFNISDDRLIANIKRVMRDR